MNTALIIAAVIGVAFIFLKVFGSAKINQGRTQERAERLLDEIDSFKKAKQIEDDHKHDSRSDVVDDL